MSVADLNDSKGAKGDVNDAYSKSEGQEGDLTPPALPPKKGGNQPSTSHANGILLHTTENGESPEMRTNCDNSGSSSSSRPAVPPRRRVVKKEDNVS